MSDCEADDEADIMFKQNYGKFLYSSTNVNKSPAQNKKKTVVNDALLPPQQHKRRLKAYVPPTSSCVEIRQQKKVKSTSDNM